MFKVVMTKNAYIEAGGLWAYEQLLQEKYPEALK